MITLLRTIVLPLILVLSSCSKEEIRIGYLAGLSETNSELGSMGRKALDMALAKTNAQEKLQGRVLRLIVADDKNRELDAVKAFHFFKEKNVHLVIGPIISGILHGIFPLINEQQMLFISPTVNALCFSGKNDYFYRIAAPNDQIGRFLARCILKLGLRRIAVLQEVSNFDYTQGILDAFQKETQELDVTILPVLQYDMTSDKDYLKLTQQLIQSAPEVFLLLTNGFESALLSQQLAKEGHMQPVFLPSWAMTHDLIELGGKQTSRVYLVGAFDPQSQNALYTDFKNQFRKLYNKDPDISAVFVWDAYTVALTALQNAKIGQPSELKKSLDTLQPVEGLQSSIIFDVNGDANRKLFLFRIQDGYFVRVDP